MTLAPLRGLALRVPRAFSGEPLVGSPLHGIFAKGVRTFLTTGRTQPCAVCRTALPRPNRSPGTRRWSSGDESSGGAGGGSAASLFLSAQAARASAARKEDRGHEEAAGKPKLKQSNFLLDLTPGRAPVEVYQDAVLNGLLQPDTSQVEAVRLLNELYGNVSVRSRVTARKRRPNFLSVFTGDYEDEAPKPEKTKGLYFWGGVGCGKTMMMDLFYKCVPLERKRRLHLSTFLLELHQQLHEARQTHPKSDPMEVVVKTFTEGCTLLCLDELQLYDVGNVMLLRRVLTALLEKGVVLVSTSNRSPETLSFNVPIVDLEPLSRLLKENCTVHQLSSPTDYRFLGTKAETYFTPLDEENIMKSEKLFLKLVGPDPEPERLQLEVQGHVVSVPWAVSGLARFSFKDLCGQDLAAADYIAIADAFPTLFVTRIPIMSPVDSSEARRFITLIDICYERKVKLVCTAEAPPPKLFVVAGTELEADCFATIRTVSRLMEMQTEQY
eukprot:RCo030311